jgi:uncharacterized protein YaaQ
MKLLIAVVNRRDCRRLQEALEAAGLRGTEVGSTGGLLGEGHVTLLVEAEGVEVEAALALIEEHCQAREEVINAARPEMRGHATGVPVAMTAQVGGAKVYVLEVERIVEV